MQTLVTTLSRVALSRFQMTPRKSCVCLLPWVAFKLSPQRMEMLGTASGAEHKCREKRAAPCTPLFVIAVLGVLSSVAGMIAVLPPSVRCVVLRCVQER